MDEAVRIAFEAGLPYTGLHDFRPDERLWAGVAPEWARRERVVPLVVVGGRLKLAAAHPAPDLQPLHGHYAGVDVVIAPAHEIDAALADLPGAPAEERRAMSVTDPAAPQRLGDLLVAHGVATDEEVADALREQGETGGRLGDVLVAHDAIPEERLLAVLAEQLGLPIVDLHGYQPDPAALAIVPEELQRELRCVPLALDEATVYVAVAEPLEPEALARLRDGSGGLDPRCFLAARGEVDDLLQALHSERWAAMASTALDARYPEESATRPVRPAQALLLALLVLAVIAGIALAPARAAVVLSVVAAVMTLAPTLLAVGLAAGALILRRRGGGDGSDETTGGMPLTTLLLPLGGGAGTVARAAGTLAALDHPRARLEVLLLCPAGDVAGIRAARELARPRPHRLVVVPAGVPQTRAGVLAYGLLMARGEQLAVLEPGDVPAPGFLRTAGQALASGGRRVMAAQTALVPPSGPGLLAGWLAAECATWHELLAPSLARAGLPLPLSSSGVVLRREGLRAIEGWDPAGLAEGVDLGLRLHKAGYRATVADAAVGVSGLPSAGGWVHAHARWWRGTVVAYAVQLRHPLRAARRMGPIGATVKLVLGAGAVVAPLLWPAVLVAAAFGALEAAGVTGELLPHAATWLAGLQVLAVSVVVVVLGVVASLRRRSGPAARAALLAPVGLVLLSLAAWQGVAAAVGGLGRGPSGDGLGRW